MLTFDFLKPSCGALLSSLLICVVMLISPQIAHGADTLAKDLDRLDRRAELIGWEAVGRIDIKGKGTCSGALIAADLVLTAAHCFARVAYNSDSKSWRSTANSSPDWTVVVLPNEDDLANDGPDASVQVTDIQIIDETGRTYTQDHLGKNAPKTVSDEHQWALAQPFTGKLFEDVVGTFEHVHFFLGPLLEDGSAIAQAIDITWTDILCQPLGPKTIVAATVPS